MTEQQQQNERLNQARIMLEKVTTSEKLLLTQAVCKLGSTNWNLISNLLNNNPNLDLNSINVGGGINGNVSKFNSQFCAFVFGSLMHNEGFTDLSQASQPNSRPGRILAHKFYTARIQELVSGLIQGKRDEQLLNAEILEINSGAADDKILNSLPPAIKAQILQQRQVQAEQEAAQLQQQQSQSQSISQQPMDSTLAAIASGSGATSSTPSAANTKIHPTGTPIPSLPPSTSTSTTKKPTTRVSRSSAIPIKESTTSSRRGERMSTSDNETGTEDDENEKDSTLAEPEEKTTSTGKKGKNTTAPKPRKSLRGKASEQVSEAEPEIEEEEEEGEAEADDEAMELKEETAEEGSGVEGEKIASTNRKGKNSKAVTASLAAAAKRKSKRKTSEPVDSSPPPESKGKKARMDTEEVEEGSGQPATLTEKESKAAIARFKRSTNALLDRLSDLPDAHHFKSPVPRSIAPNYNLAIKKPMCIRDVTRRVKEGVLTTSEEVIRDVALIFANAVQYNGLVVKEGEVAMGIQAQGVWEEFERMMEIQLNLEARNSTT